MNGCCFARPFVALGVVLVAAVGTGCSKSCEEVRCEDYCATFGGSEEPDKVFQECLKNSSATGGDFILRDADGEDVYECHIEYDALGAEVGSCSYDFVEARYAYCGCTSTYGYY